MASSQAPSELSRLLMGICNAAIGIIENPGTENIERVLHQLRDPSGQHDSDLKSITPMPANQASANKAPTPLRPDTPTKHAQGQDQQRTPTSTNVSSRDVRKEDYYSTNDIREQDGCSTNESNINSNSNSNPSSFPPNASPTSTNVSSHDVSKEDCYSTNDIREQDGCLTNKSNSNSNSNSNPSSFPPNESSVSPTNAHHQSKFVTNWVKYGRQIDSYTASHSYEYPNQSQCYIVDNVEATAGLDVLCRHTKNQFAARPRGLRRI